MADNSQTRTARRKAKNAKKKPIWKKILLAFGIIFLAIAIGVGVLFTYYIATAPEIDASKLSDPLSSKIYDKDGELFADLGSEKRTKIEYDDLPQVLIDAVIATEDSRFFEHNGIDLRRIGAAIIANFQDGFGSEGASTITQQVVEKSFLPPDKKIKLKVQEQWLALKLEREYSKEQILEMYLNKIYYGSGAYGVAKAAQVYFGKSDLNDLTLQEAAILAGLPQRPSAYDPYEDPDLTKERMTTVLNLMVRHDKISEKEAKEAIDTDIPSLLAGKKTESTPYQAFLQQVRDEVKEKLDGADIYTDGLKIYTTLDTDVQEYVEFLLSDSEDNPIQYPAPVEDADGNPVEVQAGMAVLDTKNGAIRAIGGSRDNLEKGGWNYAIDGEGRQPGSSFKPIMAYGPAIEYNKWSTYKQINDDKPFKIAGTDASINNYDNRFHGWMTMRTALAESYNVPAVKTLDEIGTENAQKFAEGLGIRFDDDTVKIGDAIGGTDTNVTPLKMAGAFRAFANEGIYNAPYAVTKVEYPDGGKTVDLKPESKAVMSDYTAYMITDMLKSVMSSGTGTEANIPGLPVAGKTGTTNIPGEEGSPDSWFSGYTTNYTISIWTGYGDTNQRVLPTTKIPHALFKNTMSEISKDVETTDFVKPDSVVRVAVEKGSNPAKLPSEYTPDSNVVTELFVKGTEPTATSEKFDKLDPVSGLTATYDAESNTISAKWDYEDNEDVAFQISAGIDDREMQELSTTDEKSIEITNVEPGTYKIQVVAVMKDDETNASEAKTATVVVQEEDENEQEENGQEGNLGKLGDLNAVFDPEQQILDVTWNYNGPPAQFEVVVMPDGQQQTAQSSGIVISGVQPGKTYTITVTPIGQNGANSGIRGESATKQITIPKQQDGDGSEQDEPENEHQNE